MIHVMKAAGTAPVILALCLTAVACGSGGAASSKYPGTEEGVKQLLTDIRKEGADARAMTLALKPTTEDFKAVFSDDFAAKAQPAYEKLWSDPKSVIGASPENTELLLVKATTEEIKAKTGGGNEFPGGYARIADQMKPGITWYRWKYTKPGETLGMAYDGLTFVNGHWAWFPKPWRAAGGE